MAVEALNEAAITVLIPTFNRQDQLRKAVESVLQEDRVPIRLKIFDNASTDGTSSYVTDLADRDGRVSYVQNDSNIGAIPNYIQALSSVDTEFFVPLADDDWLLPGFLQEAYEILLSQKDLCAAVFVTEGRDKHGELIGTYPEAPDRIAQGRVEPAQHLRSIMRHGHYGWSSVLWRRRILGTLGAPYFHVGLPSDVDMQLQVFSRQPAFVVNRPGAVYLMHTGQTSQDYGVAHAFSWARLFQRLDRVVLGDGVLTWDEYIPLRQLMAKRYRGAWSAPPRTTLSERETIRAAYASGTVLGDWELAFRLVGDQNLEALSHGVREEVIALPDNISGFGDALQSRNSGGSHGLMKAVFRWMQDRLRERAAMNGAFAELQATLELQRREGQLLVDKVNALDAQRMTGLRALDDAIAQMRELERGLANERARNEELREQLGDAQLMGSLRYVPRRLVSKLMGRPLRLPNR